MPCGSPVGASSHQIALNVVHLGELVMLVQNVGEFIKSHVFSLLLASDHVVTVVVSAVC